LTNPFRGESLNPSLSRAGFYFADTKQKAIEELERSKGIPRNRIGVKKISISKNSIESVVSDKRAVTPASGARGYEFVPTSKYNLFNSLVKRGLIKFS
jgi:hypothetical protein